MISPKVSVIVPIYKAEAYIRRCIESILSQTFKDLELILVDDGSPDKSGLICDEYAIKDERVHVIHQINSGVTKARAAGFMLVSDSEYITFVDADDFLPSTAINDLYMFANSEYDIVIGNYDRNYRKYSNTEIEPETYTKLFLSGKLHFGPVARLYRRSLFNNSEIFNISRDIVVGEDLLMNLHLSFINKKKVKIIPNVVYHYYMNSGSVMNTFKYTTPYIEKLYELEKKMIFLNKGQNYMPYCIEGILSHKNTIIEDYFYNNKWKKTSFHINLLKDIREYNCKLSPSLRFSFFFSNPIYSFIHILLRYIYNFLKGFDF